MKKSGDDERGNYSHLEWQEDVQALRLSEALLASAAESSSEESDGDGRHQPLHESLDFTTTESMMWRQHHMKRFLTDSSVWWNHKRRLLAYRFMLIILCGIIIAAIGVGADYITDTLLDHKMDKVLNYVENGHVFMSVVTWVGVSAACSLGASLLCMYKPSAAGSGIPEVKAYLNGVKMENLLRYAVLMPKVLGMCLACSSGLPLGKEGPMVHVGAIVGAALSQGKSALYGTDVSWTKYQDLRSDVSKRDYVTFGAAAGIAAAFRAPIGGILFTLEEGASFWSTNLIFQSFLCGAVTLLATSLFFMGRDLNTGMIVFGTFDNLEEGRTNFHTWECILFVLMGVGGGLLGAVFVYLHEVFQTRRKRVGNVGNSWRRVIEAVGVTALMALVSVGLSYAWGECTHKPDADDRKNWTSEEKDLLDDLVQFQCDSGDYNQVASLFFVKPSIALQQLFHFREYDDTEYDTFGTAALLLFATPYFLFAVYTAGLFVPVGLFVPSLLSGAALGRAIGHIVNVATPAGTVADSGTYALLGAAAVLGGVGRMTIAGTVIMLEACGNTAYLLPLMLTFGAARYTGNAFTHSIYESMIEIKKLPFLEGQPHMLGLVDYQPIADYMAADVVTLRAVESVGRVYEVLISTRHNGFPIVNETGHLCGFIMRKHLTTLLMLRAYSYPMDDSVPAPIGGGSAKASASVGRKSNLDNLVQLKPTRPIQLETFEKNYPRYPEVGDIPVREEDMALWLDCRPYMDASPLSIGQKASVIRCYRLFRTMGLRHLVVVDDDHKVTGIITRHDISEHALKRPGVSTKTRGNEFSDLDNLPPAYIDARDQDSDQRDVDAKVKEEERRSVA